jgi:hypothetical protein
MLKVRAGQIDALRQVRLTSFVEQMIMHLRKAAPEAVSDMSPDEIDAFVRRGVRRARAYGVVLHHDVRVFLECLTRYGADFPNQTTPWAAGPLEDAALSGTAKMNRIREHEIFGPGRA